MRIVGILLGTALGYTVVWTIRMGGWLSNNRTVAYPLQALERFIRNAYNR